MLTFPSWARGGAITEYQPISRDTSNNTACNGRTKGANQKSFVFVQRDGAYDITWKPRNLEVASSDERGISIHMQLSGRVFCNGLRRRETAKQLFYSRHHVKSLKTESLLFKLNFMESIDTKGVRKKKTTSYKSLIWVLDINVFNSLVLQEFAGPVREGQGSWLGGFHSSLVKLSNKFFFFYWKDLFFFHKDFLFF